MVYIRIHENAKMDLAGLDSRAKGSAAILLAEMRDNSILQEALLVHEEEVVLESMSIQISKWLSEYNGRNKRNLWRIKPIDVQDGGGFWFRIVYAYLPPSGAFDGEYHVLAVANRNEFDYGELENEYEQRIIRDYDELCR